MPTFARAVCILLASLFVVPRAQAAGWELVFRDEFTAAPLDRQKWATRFIFDNETCDTFSKNEEQQRYRDNQNHTYHDGKLGLVARHVAPDGKFEFESGMLRSFQTFYYGYFEARVKTPTAIGTWPAFWLGVDRDGDGYIETPPEIDIFDNANNGKDATARDVFGGGIVDHQAGDPQGGTLVYADSQTDGEGVYHAEKDLTGAWHVYGLLWTPTQITLWLDGKLLFVKEYKWVGSKGKLVGPAHLLFNLAVGGPWAGRFGVAKEEFPQTFWIDYVRVCQIDPTMKTGGRTCGGSTLTPDPNKFAYDTQGAGNDVARPLLHDAELPKTSVRRGDKLALTYVLSPRANTREKHALYQYLVDANGHAWSWSKVALPVPTTQWAGKNVRVPVSIPIQLDLPPGKFRVFVAVGSPEEWDREGKDSLRSLNLDYAPDAKQRERIGQPTRFKVGEFTVLP